MTSDARREQLLDACAAIVDVEGFGAVTIERVANACGVTRTVIYQLFGGLDGMLDALVARASRRANEAVAAATGPDGGFAQILAAVDADPGTWRMFLVAPTVGPASLAQNLAAGRAAIREHNVRAVEHDAHGADPEIAARLVQAIADELVRLRLADPTNYTQERLVAAFTDASRAMLGRKVKARRS